ncbi:hypothetical protein JTB14_033456 [Gonioctena quinquepunctata]|nr:hypothetical protein JTB14_033456 [Gonioctena quinquepunctata]
MTTTKGFKVTDADRKTRVGIAVKNFEELKKKTIDKFKLKFLPGQINFQTTDGTMIENEEYFQTLPPQTLLIWVKVGEKAATDAEILYKTIREVNDEYLSAGEKVQEFFTEKMKNKVFKLAEITLNGLKGESRIQRHEKHRIGTVNSSARAGGIRSSVCTIRLIISIRTSAGKHASSFRLGILITTRRDPGASYQLFLKLFVLLKMLLGTVRLESV